jgi:Zn-dependent protease
MTRTDETPRENRDPEMGRGLRLGRIFGVELVADWSLAIIFTLIAVSLSAGVFPAWHPDWSPALSWTVGILAALFFFASIAAHEMAHAVVGRSQGIPVRRITLFIFGGMAHMEGNAPSPRAEFLMAAVGPVTSLGIGIVATALGLALAGPAASAEELVRQASPAATLLLWLGPINIILAIFNFIPGFPLDGGRVLRAILWWATGDQRRATRWSAAAGQGFAWFLMGTGVLMALGFPVPLLGPGLIGGLWLILIGWFLNNAARFGYRQLLVEEALRDVAVRDLMRPVVTTADDLSLDRFVHEHLMTSDQHAFPVEHHGRLAGLISLVDLRAVPRERWPSVTVGEVMVPASRLTTLAPGEPATTAFRHLGQYHQVPVVEDGQVQGMVRREDMARWLALRSEEARP